MPQDASSGTDDESLVLRMMDGDDDALRLFIDVHEPTIRGALKKRYRGVLADPEIDEAMNWAAFKVYRSIGDFDVNRSTLRSWFYVIAIRVAQDILKCENRNRYQALDDAFGEEAAIRQDGVDGHADGSLKQTRELLVAIDQVLTPGEHRVMMADLAAGGEANPARLAAEMASTVRSVHALRSKGRSKIREYMIERGHVQNPQRSRR
ncbi:sigma factor (plasmid) [Isosphaeraceae bacterium EP7]